MMVSPQRGRKRLYTMLGYTLVNLNDELRFFRDTLSCCATGDLFLCDISMAADVAAAASEGVSAGWFSLARLDAPALFEAAKTRT